MKLLTTIAPRRDGVVFLNVGDAKIKFEADEHGDLVADVPDADVPRLLALGGFEPADEADFARAEEMLLQVEANGSDADADADADAEDPADPNAPPIEARTPPKAKAPPKKSGQFKPSAAQPPKPAAKRASVAH